MSQAGLLDAGGLVHIGRPRSEERAAKERAATWRHLRPREALPCGRCARAQPGG
jgi:hypothetical protein